MGCTFTYPCPTLVPPISAGTLTYYWSYTPANNSLQETDTETWKPLPTLHQLQGDFCTLYDKLGVLYSVPRISCDMQDKYKCKACSTNINWTGSAFRDICYTPELSCISKVYKNTKKFSASHSTGQFKLFVNQAKITWQFVWNIVPVCLFMNPIIFPFHIWDENAEK